MRINSISPYRASFSSFELNKKDDKDKNFQNSLPKPNHRMVKYAVALGAVAAASYLIFRGKKEPNSVISNPFTLIKLGASHSLNKKSP